MDAPRQPKGRQNQKQAPIHDLKVGQGWAPQNSPKDPLINSQTLEAASKLTVHHAGVVVVSLWILFQG